VSITRPCAAGPSDEVDAGKRDEVLTSDEHAEPTVLRDEQATSKRGHMALMSLAPDGKGRARWTMLWKTMPNAFDGRLRAARQ
jgi:hypothetical protein